MLLCSVTSFTCPSRLSDRKGVDRASVELGTGVIVEERKGRGGNRCNEGNLSKVLSKCAEEDAEKFLFPQQKMLGRGRGR